ncbi:MAG: FapA family protein, partial [Clostridiaceae bacterium]|nr:FapA family protein [Clostridiaceae bacterium]
PNITYKLKDVKAASSVELETEVKEETMPPKFTVHEIENELINHNIKYGILKVEIIKCSEAEIISELLIAKGKKPIKKTDDRLEIKYDLEHKELSENHDTEQIVDYKAIGTVNAVEKGQVLAILYPGADGEDGEDITGKIVKTKNAKKIVLAAGAGAEMKDECTVVAASEGRPSAKGNTFFVYKIYEVNGDVELKTGNIKFLGDIIIHGSVHEGMSVEAGNSILIKDNVAEAIISASGDIAIRGNIFHSAIYAGKEDVITQEYLSDLMSMKNDLEKIIASISQLKEMNLLEKNTSDGELIKILLETKFKKLPKTAIKVLEQMSQLESEEDPLVFIIKHKILNLGPLSIEHYEELNDAVPIIDNKITKLSIDLTLPVDVVLDYCQDSIIKSSGNVIFSGKGQYVSQIHASNSVIFKKDKSVARGGLIKAGKEIKCKTVGGHGGVSTQLIVENHGQIWADVAYSNTRFIIGAREYVLDITSKDVHAYIDDSGELVVDKLLL